MAEAPGYWKAEHALAMREVEELKHDIARYVEIASEEATRAASLEARVKRLERCLLPVWMGMAEAELVGEPLPDDAVVLSFMGSGASDRVTAGEVRAALKDIPDA